MTQQEGQNILFSLLTFANLWGQFTVRCCKFMTLFADGKGDERFGVCSNYLERLEQNDEVELFVRSAPGFHLPKDTSQPIILIGPGKLPLYRKCRINFQFKYMLKTFNWQALGQLHSEVSGKSLTRLNHKMFHSACQKFGYFSAVEPKPSIFTAKRSVRWRRRES